MPTHQGFRTDDRDCLQYRRKPSIQQNQEQPIVFAELDATAHFASQHSQLMPECGILSFKLALRPERGSKQIRMKHNSATIVFDVRRFGH